MFGKPLVSTLIPLGIVFVSGALGMFLQKIVLARLRRISEKSAASWADILTRSLKGLIFLWTLLFGLAIALKAAPLKPDLARPLGQALIILAIFSVTHFLARAVSAYIVLCLGRIAGFPVSIFPTLTAFVIYTLGLLIILDYLKISITPLITALGVGGLAVALALQDTLSNLFSGLHILATRKVRPGDYIKLEPNVEGYIRDITWRNTTIEALAGNLIIIPNSKLATGILTNFDLPASDSAVLVDFGVAYKTDLRRCEEVVGEVAKDIMARVPGGMPTFTPFVRFHTFGDFAIQGTIILRGGRFVDRYLIKHELVKSLHERFAREGIEIPFPARTVRIRKNEE
jgi:small-conductance mechanosensitive channel